MTMIDCVVVGPGGVGGYLAAGLAQGGLDVAVVARGGTREAIERDGLRLIDPQRPDAPAVRVGVAGSLAEAPAAKCVVLAMKQPDLAPVLASLPSYLARSGDDAVVLAVQNGVLHLSGPLATVAPSRTLVGSVYIFSHVETPGVIRVLGGPRLYRFGPLHRDDAALAARAREIAAQWMAAGVFAAADDDGPRVVWEKLCLLAPLSGMTALTARTIGEIRELPDAMHTFRTLCNEVRAVGIAEGVSMGDDLVDVIVSGIEGTDPDGRSSLYRDLVQGRDSELEVLLGDVLDRADAHGVPVPAFRTLYAATRLRYGVDLPAVHPGDPDAARALVEALGEQGSA